MRIIILFCLLVAGTSLSAQSNFMYLQDRFQFIGDISVGTTATTAIAINFPSSTQDYTINCTAPFLLSLDSSSFSSSVQLSAAQSGATLPLYVQYAPTAVHMVNKGTIAFSRGNAVNSQQIYLLASSFPADSFYNVLCWNIMWFGDPATCDCDTALQRQGVTKALQAIRPKVIAMQEVVEHASLKQVQQSLGANYSSNISPNCSFALDTFDASWPSGQKMGYIFDTSIFSPITSYAYAAQNLSSTNSGTEYWAFASGRTPFVQALLQKGTEDTTWFFNMHAKAQADQSSYNRREVGAYFLNDTFNTYYAQRQVVLVGDYNDKLEGSITTGNSNSPYKYMISNAMNGISLPSLYPAQTSYVFNSSIIDNLCLSSAAAGKYGQTSYTILDEFYDVYDSYPYTVSDHYPYLCYFKRGDQLIYPASIKDVSACKQLVNLVINGKGYAVQIPCGDAVPSTIRIYNLQGQLLQRFDYSQGTSSLSLGLPQGMYILQVVGTGGRLLGSELCVSF
jgi:trimeric autotransporter adhesin